MKLTDMRCWVHRTPRTEAFVTARGRSDEAVNVVIELSSDRWRGYGAATQNDVTGESADSILVALERFHSELMGRNVANPVDMAERLDEILDGNCAAKAGIDIAFHDLVARSKRKRLMDYLYAARGNRGMAKERMLNDVTVGLSSDLEDVLARTKAYVDEGYMAVKLKIGTDPRVDLEMVRAMRDRLGKGFSLRLDANQGYTVDQALEFVGQLEGLAVEFVEQPVSADDLDGLEEVAMASPVPIMADESVWNADDVERIGSSDICDLINIKLMKSGGLTRAMQMLEIADKYGIRTMVGCMAEGRATLAAALALALSQEDIIYADLDSYMRLGKDYSRGGLIVEDGYLIPGDDAGTSVELLDNEDRGKRVPLGSGGRAGSGGSRRGGESNGRSPAGKNRRAGGVRAQEGGRRRASTALSERDRGRPRDAHGPGGGSIGDSDSISTRARGKRWGTAEHIDDDDEDGAPYWMGAGEDGPETTGTAGDGSRDDPDGRGAGGRNADAGGDAGPGGGRRGYGGGDRGRRGGRWPSRRGGGPGHGGRSGGSGGTGGRRSRGGGGGGRRGDGRHRGPGGGKTGGGGGRGNAGGSGQRHRTSGGGLRAEGVGRRGKNGGLAAQGGGRRGGGRRQQFPSRRGTPMVSRKDKDGKGDRRGGDGGGGQTGGGRGGWNDGGSRRGGNRFTGGSRKKKKGHRG